MKTKTLTISLFTASRVAAFTYRNGEAMQMVRGDTNQGRSVFTYRNNGAMQMVREDTNQGGRVRLFCLVKAFSNLAGQQFLKTQL